MSLNKTVHPENLADPALSSVLRERDQAYALEGRAKALGDVAAAVIRYGERTPGWLALSCWLAIELETSSQRATTKIERLQGAAIDNRNRPQRPRPQRR